MFDGSGGLFSGLMPIAIGMASMGCASVRSQLQDEGVSFARYPLPTHERVPESPDLTVERYVIVDAPAGVLYETLLDLSTYDVWEPDVTIGNLAEFRDPLQPGDHFDWERSGNQLVITVLDVEENRYFRARGDTSDGIVGIRSFHFVQISDNQTAVIAYEEFSKWYFPLFAWASDFGMGEQMDGTLSRLKSYAEKRVATPKSVAGS